MRTEGGGLTVVFEHPNGYVTDMGETLTLKCEDKTACDYTLDRYGVWMKESGKFRVVHVTDNLDDAKRVLTNGLDFSAH